MAERDDARALLIYDGDCALCRLWVDAWRAQTGDRVVYAPSQEITEKFPDIPRAKYRRAVQLIDADGRRYEAAEAVFRALAHAPGRGWLLRLYEAPLVGPIAEAAYRLVARHRGLFLRVTKLVWGPKPRRLRYGLVGRVFLQALSVIYLVAFLSWLPQLPGLVGAEGILPSAVPVGALQAAALLGAAVALLAFAGVILMPALLFAWLLYLLIVVQAGEFSAFQWDGLLLEAGFLAMFLAPFRSPAAGAGRVRTSLGVVWLYRFLLFRLFFSSGVLKLASGDPAWRTLDAVKIHLETQPLPTALAWHAHRLPDAVLKAGTLATLVAETVVPFLFLMPRRARLVGAGIAVALQIMKIMTGNVAFLDWLTLALCLFLLDDGVLERLVPRLATRKTVTPPEPRRAVAALATVVVALGLLRVMMTFLPVPGWPRAAADAAQRLGIVNGYGLFATMPASRSEVVIEGSMDGKDWKPYHLPHAPGDVKRAPTRIAPFQPRLDWHMWFAGLSEAEADPWFPRLMVRLLQGSKPVLALFAGNPFPEGAPKHVRATLYRYRFTTPEERALDGAWWRREMKVTYFPEMSLKDLSTGGP